MVLTKAYLRYVPAGTFGVVASSKSNCVFIRGASAKKAQYVGVAALENVNIWNVKTGEKMGVLAGEKHEVTSVSTSPDGKHLAVGYNDGFVKIWEWESQTNFVTFSGHRKGVSALQYDESGTRLVSGSKDTDVIVWDIVNETGLYRLKGHKGMITQCQFMRKYDCLITSSKDTFVKFWDLSTQHCFLTLTEHRNEVCDFVLICDETRLVTGAMDNELRMWDVVIDNKVTESNGCHLSDAASSSAGISETDSQEKEPVRCQFVGSLQRQSSERVVSLRTHSSGQYIGCHGSDSLFELYSIRSEVEIQMKLKKKARKARRKRKKLGDSEEDAQVEVIREVGDEIHRIHSLTTHSKIRSFDFALKRDQLELVLLLHDNSIEWYNIVVMEKSIESERKAWLMKSGHRTDIRTVCFTSDDLCILSASNSSVKVWNRESLQCIHTMESGYAVSSMFVPGDRHALIGTKVGELQLFDVSSGTLLETISAHQGSIWSLCLAPDRRGFITGSADHEVRFWEFELIQDDDFSLTSKRLSMAHVKTLEMTDDVLCVKFSPDYRLLAVALLDNTVKVFFADSLKYFLSLYGHKLPVLTMDISSDSTLLVSGSSDKNIKLWGLDFGDCHKSLFAHNDSIMAVQFVPKTHLFFSASKDHTVKCWDGDKFKLVQTFEGHHAEIWCLAVSHDGNTVVSGAHDRSLRLWERTQEPLFVEEEQEMEREKEYEESLAQGPEPVIPGEAPSEVAMAGRKSMETVKATERIMEAIELAKEETFKKKEHEALCKSTGKQVPPPIKHPLILASGDLTHSQYVLGVVKKIRSSELDESLLVLPFSYVMDFLKLLNEWIQNGWEIDLSCRCLFFLLRIHHNQIVSSKSLLSVMDSLRQNTRKRVQDVRDIVGFNMAGLRFLQQKMAEKNIKIFGDVTDRLDHIKKKRKLRTKSAQ
ncbi:WD repeat-containing protein 3-like [Corticium candelabrum]|uniref:WD repeat-containing protein 3-like n=1 Tax=Corticium candelabrum TaxID=121492 RepID=UPI002E262796|nr:WD repeat-containing protein 3-like [Corticium candelabrum]